MLLGIALVVDDANKGQRLVFRYPALREHGLRHGKTNWALQRCAAEFHQLVPEVFARLFRPKAPLCGRPFQVCIDRVRYLSYPVLTASATKETATDDVLLFNIILAMARLPPTAQHSNQPRPQQSSSAVAVAAARRRSLVWRRAGEQATPTHGKREDNDGRQLRHLETVLEHLTKALLHEERRCRYVSKEVGRLLDMREAAYGKEGWGTAEDAQTMLDTMMEESALASDLKEVYHGLKDAEGLDIAINGWVRLSLPGLLLAVRDRGEEEEDEEEDEDELALVNARPERLQPYHTLLLLMGEETILAKLPKDGSEQLATFVQAANPLKTLEEISAATRIALPYLRLLTAHLVHWGFARAIRTISLRSVYAVSGCFGWGGSCVCVKMDIVVCVRSPRISILQHHTSSRARTLGASK